MPMRGELPTAAARPAVVRPYGREPAAATAWSRFVTIVSDPDLHFLIGFCTVGLLLMVNVVLWFPNFGETVAALEIFP